MVTKDQLIVIFPNTPEETLESFVDPINKTIAKFGITHEAMFLAQIGHESGGLTHFVENLNYSGQRLLQVFPKYFNAGNVGAYAHNPEKIANRVYANRMGNGDEASGDGWKFRGKGAIQLTGRGLQSQFASEMGMDLDQVSDYLTTPEGAVMSAGWYWSTRHCEASGDDIKACTIKINGGLNGLPERKNLYEEAQKALALA